MHNRWIILPVAIVMVCIFFSGCMSTTPQPPIPATPSPVQSGIQTISGSSPGEFSIRVDSVDEGSVLPDVYSCKGSGESPEVAWDGIPAGTKSLVLILDDPDAPKGRFTHWIVYNIPPISGELGQGQPNAKVLANGAQQGDTSAGSRGYYAPCPPVGTTHRYVFRLYAVDMDITQPTADRDSIDWALTGHTISETKVMTTFKR